jgi:hypothetical protein
MTEENFIEILLRDLSAEMVRAASTTDELQRRSVIRSGFATVEGLIAFIKQIITNDLHLNPGLYSEGEVALLRELTYSTDDRGNVRSSPKFIPTEANLLFTIKMWCRGVNDGRLDLSGAGWQNFNASLKLRHRLVHPKCAADLVVCNDEFLKFVLAMNWFMSSIHEKLAEVLAATENNLKQATD